MFLTLVLATFVILIWYQMYGINEKLALRLYRASVLTLLVSIFILLLGVVDKL